MVDDRTHATQPQQHLSSAAKATNNVEVVTIHEIPFGECEQRQPSRCFVYLVVAVSSIIVKVPVVRPTVSSTISYQTRTPVMRYKNSCAFTLHGIRFHLDLAH